MAVRKVAVIGSGLMGHGIAEVFALKGFQVHLYDIYEEALQKAKEEIAASLQRLVKSGKIGEQEARSIVEGLKFTSDLNEAAGDADLVVEAVPESVELKHNVLREVEKVCRPDAIIASNTSNIRITELAEVSERPENIVGMHFFNPPVVMKLIEVVKGEKTSDEAFATTVELASRLGKTAIKVMKDTPGFVVNRISAPEGLLFCLMQDNGIAQPAEIDTFAKSQGLPMGPYELMDYVGIDTVVHSLNYYSKELSPDYGKCRTFPRMVGENRLGRKTGEGFYIWEGGKAKIPEARPTGTLQLLDVLALEVNEAVKLIEEGVAVPSDIEDGVKLGMNRPFGPIAVAQGLTNREIKEKLDSLYDKYQVSVFKPARSIEEGLLKDAIAGKVAPPRHEEPKAGPVSEAIPIPPTGEQSQEAPVSAEKVLLSRSGFVATITLNNGRLNLINHEVLKSIDSILDELQNDRETRVIVINGNGDNLSAGAELSQFVNSPVDFMETSRLGQRIFKRLAEMPQLTIAIVKGYAFGGGMELSLAADIRFATPDSQMGQTEILRGLVPGWGGSQRLTRLIGFSRASFLILTGEKITGKDAFEYGLAVRIYDREKIVDETMKFAREISETASPSGIRVAKPLLYKGSESSLDAGLDMEAIAMGLLYGTDDLKEGVAAFLQKRKPEFKGR